jgi:hypothetical protein
MRLIGIVSTIFLMHVASVGWSAVAFQCYPNLEVSWSFDRIEKKSKFFETTDNLSSITLQLDTGFLKLSNAQNNGTTLFRQQAIIKKSEDPLDITVKYEVTNKIGIENTGIIFSDPLCKRSTDAVVSMFTTAELRYSNITYVCDCLSPTFDNYNFIYNH